MKKKMPLVSVIMPVYNGAPYVEKAVQSIMDQTYQRLELLIVDNGSSDKTKVVIHTFKKRFPNRIKLYTFQKNKGAFFAANYALPKARGRYVAMMDADDISDRKRIATQVAYLQAHPQTIVLGAQATIIDSTGKVIGQKNMPTDHEHIYRQFAIVHPMVHPSVMINRALLPNPNVLYACKYGVNDDYYTFFKLLAHGTFANLPDALLKYRVHTNNSSLNNLKQNFWNIHAIRKEAITKLNYQPPVWAFPIIVLQTMVVAVVPEKYLRELFYVLRGIKKISFVSRFPELKLLQFRESVVTKLKAYATAFLA